MAAGEGGLLGGAVQAVSFAALNWRLDLSALNGLGLFAASGPVLLRLSRA